MLTHADRATPGAPPGIRTAFSHLALISAAINPTVRSPQGWSCCTGGWITTTSLTPQVRTGAAAAAAAAAGTREIRNGAWPTHCAIARRQDLDPACRQFDRERKAVQPTVMPARTMTPAGRCGAGPGGRRGGREATRAASLLGGRDFRPPHVSCALLSAISPSAPRQARLLCTNPWMTCAKAQPTRVTGMLGRLARWPAGKKTHPGGRAVPRAGTHRWRVGIGGKSRASISRTTIAAPGGPGSGGRRLDLIDWPDQQVWSVSRSE